MGLRQFVILWQTKPAQAIAIDADYAAQDAAQMTGIVAAGAASNTPDRGQLLADFGEAVVVIGGIEQKPYFFVMDLPHSNACYIRAYPAAAAEAWVDGHVLAFLLLR
jgi:hypothetical protein